MNRSNESVIRARELRKVYRLYAGQSYKFLDMFGLLRRNGGAYTEHAALDGVNLDVHRGEKVAFIGRNGAGKSTLLKLVTRVIEPTSGTIDVRGKVHALLQIGTGFHPDFTGRENVYAYLAQLGITGREADRQFDEILEFAELEEYIGQPVKTYSTGMAVRLMFSTATAITPELLVLDEVLGVGDAYFAQKSYERMRELCEGAGTTLLLVTHDVYAASRLCDRIVWIDRGRILMDGEGPLVIKAYEDSIRQQEEHRLRLKKRQRLKDLARDRRTVAHLLFEIRPLGGKPLAQPVYFSRIAAAVGGRTVAAVPLDANAFSDASGSHLQKDASCWGDPVTWNGRPSRPMLNYGGSFHKVAGVLELPVAELEDPAAVQVEFDYGADSEAQLTAQCFWDQRALALGSFDVRPGMWTRHVVALPLDRPAAAAPPPAINTDGVHGSGAIVVQAACFLDAEGCETHMLRHGEPATLQLDLRLVDPALCERSQVVIALHRDGVQDVCRWISRDLLFETSSRPVRRIQLRISKVLLIVSGLDKPGVVISTE